MKKKTATTHKKWLETHEKWVHFVHRDAMRRTAKYPEAKFPGAEIHAPVPATTLPVDCTGNATVSCPMDGNDEYGDCGPVMCAHVNTIRTYGQGKPGFTPVLANVSKLVTQYELVSGGDNGTTEDMLVGSGGIWLSGIADDSTQTVVDHLDFDITNQALTQYLIDQFYTVEMAWSVPDDVLQTFTTGIVYSSPATPNPEQGHFTPLADIESNGYYRLFTWGTYCVVSPAFVASVEPECFATFSALQFLPSTGYDSHGRHVSDQAAAWVAIGGNSAKVAAVVAKFPSKTGGPPPAPVATKPTSIWGWIVNFFRSL